MQEPDLLTLFVRPLNAGNFAYMVTGSMASIIYGEPRLTHDIDLVIELHRADAQRLPNIFPMATFYCPPEEVIIAEIRRATRGHFNLIHHESGFKADIYLVGQDPLHHWGLQHRRCVEMEGERIWFAPPEYVILRKLQFFQEGHSEKHIQDIRGMLEASGPSIDQELIAKRALELGLEKAWHMAKRPLES